MIIVIGLSVLAAFLFAAAAYLQQRAARAVVAVDPSAAWVPGIGGLVRRLLRSTTWLRGWLTNLCGFLTQAGALHLGSVAVVQPLMSTQLLFSLPFAAAEQRRRPSRRDWLAALAVSGGLALLLTTQGAAPFAGDPRRDRIILSVASAAVLVVILALISTRFAIQTAAHLVAIAAGLCFAMSAVFMKLTMTDLVDRGIGATATDWPGYLLAASTLTGLLLEQAAFAGGPLPWAIAAMSVTNPVASYIIGMLAFDVKIPTDPGSLAGMVGALTLIAVGVAGLSHSMLALSFYASGDHKIDTTSPAINAPRAPII
ncbi:hypothetical protein FOS14_07800 [Skermania sp. ID1734]|uniref:DMT family transporter n=1 Tax=Skermania sp. ID1734 TaxID=2597516 RepID=UPI0011802BAA|nr:DMT family transporter [Skermania sp. ID1734]TSE00323.1 hypothetical protein FOS14_07800 [Skermania sp. ID1734]